MKPEELVGKIVVFNYRCSHEDIDFDAGMKARVCNFQLKEDNTVLLFFDFSEFEEDNKVVAQPNYYDENGKPSLKWHETRFYPKPKCRYEWYFDLADMEKNKVCFDLDDETLRLKAKEIRHAIADILAAHQINVTGQIDSELNEMLLKKL